MEYTAENLTLTGCVEPTVVPPVLLELCSIAVLHRFSSPAWWEHVAKHVSADVDSKSAFDAIVKLQVLISSRKLLLPCAANADANADRTGGVTRTLGAEYDTGFV